MGFLRFSVTDVTFTDIKTIEAASGSNQQKNSASAHGRRPSATPAPTPAVVEPVSLNNHSASYKQKSGGTQLQQQHSEAAVTTSPNAATSTSSVNHNMSASSHLSASSLSVASSDGSR